MNLLQFLEYFKYLVSEIVSSSLFALVFPCLMAFVAIMGCVSIVRYIISLRR